MRSTEWLSASRSVLGLVPRPARIAPRAAIGDRGRSLLEPMTEITEPEKPCYWARTLMAVLCFVGFSITMPPLGFLMFLALTGVVDKRSSSVVLDWLTPFEDFLMPALIVGFGLLSLYMIFTRKVVVFRCLSVILISLTVASLGGCVISLSNFKNGFSQTIKESEQDAPSNGG